MNWSKIVGVIIMIFNVWIILTYTKLLYQYHFTKIQFFDKSSDWVVCSYILIGTVGGFIGYQVFGKKITLKKGLPIALGLILLAFSIVRLTN